MAQPFLAVLLGFLLAYPVIPTGVAGLFFLAVRGVPATERRDHGNQHY